MQGKTGVMCPTCGVRLVIVQWRVAVAALVIFFAGLAITNFALLRIDQAFPELTESHPAAMGVPPVLLVVMLAILVPPRFAQVRFAADDENVDYPLSR